MDNSIAYIMSIISPYKRRLVRYFKQNPSYQIMDQYYEYITFIRNGGIHSKMNFKIKNVMTDYVMNIKIIASVRMPVDFHVTFPLIQIKFTEDATNNILLYYNNIITKFVSPMMVDIYEESNAGMIVDPFDQDILSSFYDDIEPAVNQIDQLPA